MGIQIKRDKLGRVFIRNISEDTLTTTITALDVDLMEEQAERDAESRNAEADAKYVAHAFDTTERVGKEVFADIRHQFTKFGAQRLDGMNWIAVICEEYGETVQAYLKGDYESAYKEAKQTIACLARFIIEMEREGQGAHVVERDRYTRAQ